MNTLYKKINLGRARLPNRVCFMAHRTNFGAQGRLSDRHVAYYRRRAQGGCGLIIVGELSVSPNDRPYESTIAVHQPRTAEDFRRLTEAVHNFDTRVFAQLNHHGFQSSGQITRQAIWAPSPMADFAFGETGQAMEEEDMEELVRDFGRAAAVAREGGFDGLQINMGHQSLLQQFLSPISNHRQDQYGGSLENRLRLPLRVLDEVRRTVGRDFTVGLLLCVDEKFWGGITPEESTQFARIFEQTGQVDFIQASLATFYNTYLIMASMHTPAGFTLELSEQLKQHVQIPVIAGLQIGFPKMAEEAVARGQADAVGFVRALIADPDMVNKHREGRTAEIRFCAWDNMGCVYRLNQSKPITCVQNPRVGRETMTGMPEEEKKTDHPAKVIVIGAGPAGMAAAAAAARRGHSVSVYDSSDQPGGQVNLSRLEAGRSGMAQITRYLKNALARLAIPIHLNTAMDAARIMDLSPDAVVVATGCVPVANPFPGDYGPPTVLTLWDVLKTSYPVGEKVLFIDEIGNHSTLAGAEMLAEQGKKVEVVTSDPYIGIGLATLGDLNLSLQRLLQKGVILRPDVSVEEIDDNRVLAKGVYDHKPIVFEGYDTIIAAVDFVPLDGLYFELKDRVGQLYRAGDCVAPRGIGMAIYEGEKVGRSCGE